MTVLEKGACLICLARSRTTTYLVVDGNELQGIERNTNRICIECVINRATEEVPGNELADRQYRHFINVRTIKNESHWDMDYTGSYVLIRFGATASFLALRDLTSSEWRLSRVVSVDDNRDTLVGIGTRFRSLTECRDAAMEHLQDEDAYKD